MSPSRKLLFDVLSCIKKEDRGWVRFWSRIPKAPPCRTQIGKAWTPLVVVAEHSWMRFPCLSCLAFGLLGANGAGRKPGIPGFGALPEYVPEAHAADVAEGSQQQAAPPPQQSGALSESQQQQMMQFDKVLSDDKDDEQLMPLIDAVSALPGGLLMLKNAIKEESNVDPELHSELSSIVSMGGGSGALMKQPFWARLFALEGSEGEASPVDSPGPVADRDACVRHRSAAACPAGEEEPGCPRVGPA